MSAAGTFGLRVYYEDTDLAGIVYYANYLKFIERGRTEALIALGIDLRALQTDTGLVFAVRRVEADYLAPARLQDQLDVRTSVLAIGGASLDLAQDVWRGATCLFTAKVRLVCIGPDGRPTRVPEAVRGALRALGAP